MPELLIQAPQWTDYKGSPRLTLSQNGFWSEDGAYDRGTFMGFYQGKLNLGAKNGFWVKNSSVSRRNDPAHYSDFMLWSDYNSAGLRPMYYNGHGQGFHVRNDNNGIAVMAGGDNHTLQLSSKGNIFTGGKAFSMWVPGELDRGLHLRHWCTESPYSGIEYWQNVKLDDSGHGSWSLPPFVGKIADDSAPWIALAGNGASAELQQGGFQEEAGRWSVEVTGKPNTSVPVLVKGGRVLEGDLEAVTRGGRTYECARPVSWSKSKDTSLWGLPVVSSDLGDENSMVSPGASIGPCTEEDAVRCYGWDPKLRKIVPWNERQVD